MDWGYPPSGMPDDTIPPGVPRVAPTAAGIARRLAARTAAAARAAWRAAPAADGHWRHGRRHELDEWLRMYRGGPGAGPTGPNVWNT